MIEAGLGTASQTTPDEVLKNISGIASV